MSVVKMVKLCPIYQEYFTMICENGYNSNPVKYGTSTSNNVKKKWQ